MKLAGLGAALVLTAAAAEAQSRPADLRGTTIVELKLGAFKPRIDSERGLTGKPYEESFGNSSMLLGTLEVDRMFWRGFGSLGLGFSVGYAEKYGPATITGTTTAAAEKTALKVVPLKLQAIYWFDLLSQSYGVPFVPYLKAGLLYTPWWIVKGTGTETFGGISGSGAKWGFGYTAGLAFVLDFLEPSLARDLQSDVGILHTYVFAEFSDDYVNNFGRKGLVLSSRFFEFGFALEF